MGKFADHSALFFWNGTSSRALGILGGWKQFSELGKPYTHLETCPTKEHAEDEMPQGLYGMKSESLDLSDQWI